MQRKRILWLVAGTMVVGVAALAATVDLWPERTRATARPIAPHAAAPTATQDSSVKVADAAPPTEKPAEHRAAPAPEPKAPSKGTPSVVQQASTPGYYTDPKTGERKEMPFTIIATPQIGAGGQPIIGKAYNLEPAKPTPNPDGSTTPPAGTNTEEKKPG